MRRAGLARLLQAMLAAGVSAPAAAAESDRAGNRLVPFEAVTPGPEAGSEEAGRQSAVHCTAERRWCAQLRRDAGPGAWRVHLFQGLPGEAEAGRSHPVADPDGDSAFALWPQMVEEAGGAVLIGVVRSRSTGFAGGGASGAALALVRAEPGNAPPHPVLEVPIAASLSLRACFSPDDERRRAGACLAELDFAGALELDRRASEGRPRFRFRTRATSYPGLGARNGDGGRRLTPADLVRARDPLCSYRRLFAFDSGAGLYRPDRPLPDCAEYLDF